MNGLKLISHCTLFNHQVTLQTAGVTPLHKKYSHMTEATHKKAVRIHGDTERTAPGNDSRNKFLELDSLKKSG